MATITEEIESFHCGQCGVPFGLSTVLAAQRRMDGHPFWCPNGHGVSFSDSPGEKLRTAVTELAHWQAEAARLLGERDRLKERLAKRPWFWRLRRPVI